MLKLFTPTELKTALPLANQEGILSARKEIAKILKGASDRTLLIVGPCSIHDVESAKEYARRLKALSAEVDDVFLVVMRTYFEKSRTTLGWKGLLYDPSIDGSNNLEQGLRASREVLVYLNQIGLAAATEFLEPLSFAYLGDGISWGSIGARTCQSPAHRQLASLLNMPVGIKNRCDGNIDIAIQACCTAKIPHSFIGIDQDGTVCQITSAGNNMVHLVLRGSKTDTNYDKKTVEQASLQASRAGLLSSIIVDCSHDNCQGDYRKQEPVFFDVIEQIACKPCSIRGIMLESNLMAGSSLSKDGGISITDPCLDWETTLTMIRQGATMLRNKAVICA